MGSYFSSEPPIEQALKSYCINSYGDYNLTIERIEKNNDGDIVIHYKVIE